MSILRNATRGVYGQGSTGKTGGMSPVWLSADRTYAFVGATISTEEAIGTKKVRDFYPSCMVTGQLVAIKSARNAVPMPIYRVMADVDAAATKLTLFQGKGYPVLVKGTKLKNFASTQAEITVPSTITINSDGNAEITITANALGVLKAGDLLILSDVNDMIPVGITDADKEYEGVGNAVVDVRFADSGRIDGRFVDIPMALWSKYLQTIKLG